MLLSLELRSEYQEVLTKAQAVQLCGDKDPRCPTVGINEMLVSMYTANMMHDETKVRSLIRSINAYLDNAIAEANSVTQTEIMRFMVEAKEYTWVHAKLSEVSSKLDHLIQGQEIYGSAPPVRSATVKKPVVEKKPEKPVKQPEVSEEQIQCLVCGKHKNKDEYYYLKKGRRAGTIVERVCKECREDKIKNSKPYKMILKCVNELPRNVIFSTSDIVSACDCKDITPHNTGTFLRKMEDDGLIKFDHLKDKCKQYKKV